MPRPVSPPEHRINPGPIPADAYVFPRIPGYRFQKRLGEGGMASVYLATQESLDRPVAIKVMEREALADEVSMQRFENEARTIAQLTHPSIVHIYEVGRTNDGRMYYIMPYLSNGDLSQRDMRGKEDRIVEVLRTLLSALDYAHARGIVHRDVKEANVLFDVADRPLLTDFGIALSRLDKSRITSAGHAVGSSGYMAPEQARGDVVDGRADLYSVGVLAFELLTGRLPFRSPDTLALALMHAQNPVPRLPPAARHWQAFIDRAMAKSPDHRFRDARHMIEALEKVGRRTDRHLFGRVLRGYDRTVDGGIWKHPGTIALFGALLIAVGLYSARDRLPISGGSGPARDPASTEAAPTTAPPAAASPAAALNPPPAAIAKAPPATVAAAPKHPAPAIVATPPAAASPKPSPAAGVDPTIAPDAAVRDQARIAIAHGNILSPADDNAVDLAKMAWKLSPGTPETRALASDVLQALARQQALAITQHRDASVLDYKLWLLQFADATIGRDAPAWKPARNALSTALEKRVRDESARAGEAALKKSAALARQLELPDAYARGMAGAQPLQPKTAKPLAPAAASAASDLDPAFVLLPAPSKKAAPVALARAEVTRHEYAQFVNATRRPAASCGAPSPGGDPNVRKNWSEPGFSQTSEQPVVCVSWNDANAYVQWLSAQKGQHYRLATSADWHASGTAAGGGSAIAGAYGEWLQNCASGCASHLVAARGGGATATREAAQGFDDVGFRVVRVLDAPHH